MFIACTQRNSVTFRSKLYERKFLVKLDQRFSVGFQIMSQSESSNLVPMCLFKIFPQRFLFLRSTKKVFLHTTHLHIYIYTGCRTSLTILSLFSQDFSQYSRTSLTYFLKSIKNRDIKFSKSCFKSLICAIKIQN